MLSVVMPYFDRPDLLEKSLRSIMDRSDGTQIEFVIADDGSISHPARDVVDRMGSHGFRIVIDDDFPKKMDGLNPCVPLNRAVSVSSGDLLLIQNPDTIHINTVIPEMVSEFDHPGSDRIVVCAAVWCPERNEWHQHSELRRTGYHFCNMMTRALWDRSGGFDESYRPEPCYDDDDFVQRLLSVGAKFIFRDDLVVNNVWTQGRVQWRSENGENLRRFHQKWPDKLYP